MSCSARKAKTNCASEKTRNRIKIADVELDTSIVGKRSFLPVIKNQSCEFSDPAWYDVIEEVHPLASTHYVFHADSDPSTRISELGKNLPIDPHFPPPTLDPYSEEGARIKYLQSKPTCYIVFGKPGLNTEKLAESIAFEKKCILISATKLFRELDEKGESDLGCGCEPREEAVWNFIIEKLDSREVKHRGYVLEGLPLIRSETTPIKEPVIVEEAVEGLKESVNSNDYFTLTFKDPVSSIETATSETSCEHTDKSNSDSFKNSTSTKKSSKSSSIGESGSTSAFNCFKCSVSFQLQEVFKNWRLNPDIVVNFVCPDEDILTTCRTPTPAPSVSSYEHAEVLSDQVTNVDVTNTEDSHPECSTKIVDSQPDGDKGTVDEPPNASNIGDVPDGATDSVDGTSSKSLDSFYKEVNLARRKKNDLEVSEKELEYYSTHVVGAIESYIVNHNPEKVMCIDGRYPIEHVLSTINVRLQIMPIPAVIVPEPIARDFVDEGEGEGHSYEDGSLGNFSDDDLASHFEKLKRVGVSSDQFLWKLSRWGFLCPVELARGKKVEGKKNLSIKFMNLIFFLSSPEAADLFTQNPRPYLLPPNPRPTCRMVVVGPRHSGKYATSRLLAKNFDSLVIDMREIMNTSYDLDGRAIRILMEVDNLPEKYYDGFFRDRGWILDGMDLEFELCKRLLESDVEIETVVVLCESEPYSYLIKHWWEKFPEKSFASDEEEEKFVEEFEHAAEPENVDFEAYLQSLKFFNHNKNYFMDDLKNLGIRVIECDYKYIDNPAEHVIYQVRKNYHHVPKYYDPLDDGDEREQYDDDSSEKTESVILPYQELSNKIGDCNNYCPVALMKHDILWKGKPDCRYLLDDKIYMTSSENASINFLNDYLKLNLPLEKPTHVPPLRIFIIGPPGSGKSTIGSMIAKEYGLAYVDFGAILDDYLLCMLIDVEKLKSKLMARYDRQVEKEEEEGEEEEKEQEQEGKEKGEGEGEAEENYDEDFQFPESLDDTKYYFDKETVSNFYWKYLTEGTDLPNAIFKECVSNFFNVPFDGCGVLIDSFPRCIEDCKRIIDEIAIPDVIIELKCDLKDSVKRLMSLWLEKWRLDQQKLRDKMFSLFHLKLEEYLRKKADWIRQEKIKIYLQRKYGEEEAEMSHSEDEGMESCITVNSDFSKIVTDEDEILLEEIFSNLFKQPKMSKEPMESEESVKRRLENRIYESYERSVKSIFQLFNFFKNETVPWLEIDARASINEVFLRNMFALAPYALRNSSFFEKTIEIENYLAENLLASGYYFLSSFGRFCPIQLYKSRNPIMMFVPLLGKNEIFTVLHRQYVYFLAGREALEEFKKEPLKYLNQDQYMPIMPAIISIIGPPKCGKTTLSQRFSATYDFEVISRDEAIDYVLKNFPCCLLSTCIKKTLQRMKSVTSEQLAEAVKLFMSNPGCMMQGCVLDGFPTGIEEMKALTKFSTAPLVVIDLEADFEFTQECSEELEKNSTTQSLSELCNRHTDNYCEWEADAEVFRQWLVKSHGNLTRVDATKTKGFVWKQADESVRLRFAQVLKYLRDLGYDKVHDLEHLCIPPHEIDARVSRFGLYCPECIRMSKAFVSFDVLTGREGLVQYREHFYWLCKCHVEKFKAKPRWCVSAYETLTLPEKYPKSIEDFIDLDNCCWSSRLRYNGYCPVTYFDKLPKRELVPGKITLGVLYDDCLFLFCSEECRKKFCRHFLKYTEKCIHHPQVLKKLDLWKLPNIGYLEQAVSREIIRALSRVAVVRPKIPGLTSSKSVAVYVGAYLKSQMGSIESPKWEAAVKKIESRCALFKFVAENMIREESIAEEQKLVAARSATTVSKQASLSTMAVVKFKKTSPSQVLIDTDDSSADF